MTAVRRPAPVTGRLARRARPIRRAWFASDLHLHGGDPEGVARAVAFLRAVRRDAPDALFLMGDVFLAWLGPASLRDAGLVPFLDELAALVRDGLRVVLLHGNHDFLMGAEIERALGVEVERDGLDVALGGRRVRLVHGDRYCTRDRSYHRLHRLLRSPAMRFTLRRAPEAVLRRLASALVSEATRTTRRKSLATMDIVDDAVAADLAGGIDAVLCGHVHLARDETLDGGRLVVLADFESTGSHGHFAEGTLALRRHDARFATENEPVVVTLDGPAGSGKSSVARRVARRLGLVQLDSGALYRTVTRELLAAGRTPDDEDLEAFVCSLDLRLDGRGRMTLDGRPVDDASLRTAEVSALVSRVSAEPVVRRALLPVQRWCARQASGLVAEGRDMATVVFPWAELAFYLDARPEVRARRRLAQSPGEGRSLEEVASALAARDARDAGRDVAPLTRAEGAVVLDTSSLSLEDVVDRVTARVEPLLQRRSRDGGSPAPGADGMVTGFSQRRDTTTAGMGPPDSPSASGGPGPARSPGSPPAPPHAGGRPLP